MVLLLLQKLNICCFDKSMKNPKTELSCQAPTGFCPYDFWSEKCYIIDNQHFVKIRFLILSLWFLYDFVWKHLPIFHFDPHRVGSRRQICHVEAFQIISLRAQQTALQVVKFYACRFHIGRVLISYNYISKLTPSRSGFVGLHTGLGHLDFLKTSQKTIRFYQCKRWRSSGSTGHGS